MKVFIVAWTISDENLKDYPKENTGAMLVIKNLCEYIGRKEDCYLMLGRYPLPKMKIGNINIVKTDYNTKFDRTAGKNKEYIEYLTGVFEKALDEIKPDVINFQEYGDFAFLCIEKVLRKRNIPYAVTEHLFVGENPEYSGYDENIKNERRLYNIPGIKIISVSNGMKKKILNAYPRLREEQVVPLLNGTNFIAKRSENKLKEKWSLDGRKILLCVGTITQRKNQMSLVELYKEDPILKKETLILFCGKDKMDGVLQVAISDAGLEDTLVYTGVHSEEEMKGYYSLSDGLIMPSLAEGLSISCLEAMAYGIPLIMYSDSECAEDLNDEKVVCLAGERSKEAMSEEIKRFIHTKWNKEYIINKSKNFTMEKMAQRYLDYYKKIINV